MQKVLCQMHWS